MSLRFSRWCSVKSCEPIYQVYRPFLLLANICWRFVTRLKLLPIAVRFVFGPRRSATQPLVVAFLRPTRVRTFFCIQFTTFKFAKSFLIYSDRWSVLIIWFYQQMKTFFSPSFPRNMNRNVRCKSSSNRADLYMNAEQFNTDAFHWWTQLLLFRWLISGQ